MRFWDSSAVVPLIVSERETKICTKLHKEDSEIIVWTLTLTEILSAVYRKIRGGDLAPEGLPLIRSRLDRLQQGWSEIVQVEGVRSRAGRLLAVHPLRAADSLQLAAALTTFEGSMSRAELVTLDGNLKQAAIREGFTVFP